MKTLGQANLTISASQGAGLKYPRTQLLQCDIKTLLSLIWNILDAMEESSAFWYVLLTYLRIALSMMTEESKISISIRAEAISTGFTAPSSIVLSNSASLAILFSISILR